MSKYLPFIPLFKIFQVFFLTSECLLTIILIVRWVFTYRRFKILFLMGYFLAAIIKLFFNNHSSKSIRLTNIFQIILAIYFLISKWVYTHFEIKKYIAKIIWKILVNLMLLELWLLKNSFMIAAKKYPIRNKILNLR